MTSVPPGFEKRLHAFVLNFLDDCIEFGRAKDRADAALRFQAPLWQRLGDEGLQPPGWDMWTFRTVILKAKVNADLERLKRHMRESP